MLNSPNLSSFLRKSNPLEVCHSSWLLISFQSTVLRRLEKISNFINFQRLLLIFPSFLLKMTWIGSLTSCLRNQKLLLFCSPHQSMDGKWRIGLKPAKAKPWLLLSWRPLRGACVVVTSTLHGRRLRVNMEVMSLRFCSVSITGASSHPLMIITL